jgi:hypothetical protein
VVFRAEEKLECAVDERSSVEVTALEQGKKKKRSFQIAKKPTVP